MALPAFIDKKDDCDKLFEILANEPIVSLDTEFVWTKSYFPFVGIIQIGVTPEKSFIIDAVTLSECPKSFKDFLENDKIMKVCHDAFQDVQILNYYAKTTTKNVFDTQLAAAFTGFGRAISLNDLLEKIFGKTLDKSEQRADWTKRPLTAAQIEYAMDDVRYLTDCAKVLIEIAKEHGVLEWIMDDCAELSQVDEPFEFLHSVEKSYAKEVRMVPFKNRPKLYRLCFAAENLVRKKNLPRSFMFKPGVLAQIVNCNPENHDNLQKTTLSHKVQKNYAKFFSDAINDESIPINEDLVLQKLSFKNPSAAIIGTLAKELSEIIEKMSESKGICGSRIFNRKQLADLIKDTLENKEIAELHGWRNVFLGETWNDFWIKKHSLKNLEKVVL